jgi:hypothetical protein
MFVGCWANDTEYVRLSPGGRTVLAGRPRVTVDPNGPARTTLPVDAIEAVTLCPISGAGVAVETAVGADVGADVGVAVGFAVGVAVAVAVAVADAVAPGLAVAVAGAAVIPAPGTGVVVVGGGADDEPPPPPPHATSAEQHKKRPLMATKPIRIPTPQRRDDALS